MGGDVGAELDEVLLELQGRAAVALVRLEHARRGGGEELPATPAVAAAASFGVGAWPGVRGGTR
jgi:hypothetical protein